ncbi:hypothetical protein L249_5023, partial [Ophiocordyceps polyrhachis-furcata BCC 54312]
EEEEKGGGGGGGQQAVLRRTWFSFVVQAVAGNRCGEYDVTPRLRIPAPDRPAWPRPTDGVLCGDGWMIHAARSKNSMATTDDCCCGWLSWVIINLI